MSCDEVGQIYAPDGSILSFDGLPNTQFRLVFQKAPFVTMFLQGFNLPGISVNEVKRATPYVDVNEIGEKLRYVPFTCTFMVDKNLKTFREILNWMERMTVAGSNIGETDNPTLIIGGVEMCQFDGAWPTALGQLDFVTTNSDVVYLTCTATFNYDYLKFKTSPVAL